MPKLTKRVIEGLTSTGARTGTLYWDSELKGFGIRIFPSGLKTFVVKFRTRSGRQRWLKIGTFGALAPERARELAKLELAKVVEAQDPASDRDQIWLKSSPMISMRSCAGSNTAATDDLPDGGVPDGKSLVHPPPVNDHVQTSLFVKAKYPVLPPNITTRCRGAS